MPTLPYYLRSRYEAPAPPPTIPAAQKEPLGGGFFVASAAIGAISAIGNAYSQASAYRAQQDYAKRISGINLGFAEFQANDALRRGEKEAQRLNIRTRGRIGAQRSAFAAAGLQIDTGSAADIQAETAEMGAIDAMTIRNNAWREAWGYRANSLLDTGRGRISAIASQAQERSTLLTGGVQALREGISSYAAYRGRP